MSADNEFAEETIEAANAYWEMFFTDEPHTGLIQIDYLRSYANNCKWSDVLRAGWSNEEGLVALSHVADKRAAMINDPRLNEISTGRSTSFADRIVELLKYHTADRCKFEFYDVDRHRVARCEKTGILIDPSSKIGAFLLPEDEWVEILGSQASWKWDRGKHIFVSNESEGDTVVSCFPFNPTLILMFSFPLPSLPSYHPNGLFSPNFQDPVHTSYFVPILILNLNY